MAAGDPFGERQRGREVVTWTVTLRGCFGFLVLILVLNVLDVLFTLMIHEGGAR